MSGVVQEVQEVQEKTWQTLLAHEKNQHYFQKALAYVKQRRQAGVTVYPKACDVFNAFKYTAFDAVKVVILGQDPYHGEGQAHGLCFSVSKGIAIPPSLQNIFQEIQRDIGIPAPSSGCLDAWAKQGVLLLNTTLTVEAGQPQSHANIGWQIFTDNVITLLNREKTGVVFLLWGSAAQKKRAMIDSAKHHVLTTSHPSPLSAYRGFLGCGHFSRTNALLIQQNLSPIDWSLPL